MRYFIEEYSGGHADQPDDDDMYKLPDDDNCGHDYETAENAAEHFLRKHNGWESQWPLTFVLVEDDGSKSSWTVDMESVPQFHASRKKPKGGK